MMKALLSDAIAELRRPFRLRGPTSRRAFAGIALLTGAGLLCLIGLGVGTSGPIVWPVAPETPQGYALQGIREAFMAWFGAMPWLIRFLLGLTLLPLLFAMVRRSTDIGIPRFLSVAGVIVLVVSVLTLLFALDQRLGFPLTRGFWTLVTADAEDLSVKVAIGIVLSPFLLMTLIGDLLIILFVGLAAMVAAGLSSIAAVVVACIPTRKDLHA